MEGYEIIKRLEKGYSNDEKWLIRRDGAFYVLRQFEENQERREQEFDLLRQLEALGVRSLRAISMKDGEMITSYIEGDDAEDAIASLTEEQQYALGFEASKDLLKIHTVLAAEQNWAERQEEKYRRYVQRYEELGLHVEGVGQIQAFIEERLYLMQGRPSVLQHDDFHLPNLIVRDGQYAGVIDFGRFDWGDPIFDFVKLGMFSSEKSVPFCLGMIEGYYGGKPDSAFWELYGLYVAMSVFSGLVWGYLYGNFTELERQARRMVENHVGFTQSVPVWY